MNWNAYPYGFSALFFSGFFIFHHCFLAAFIADCIFSCHQLSLPWLIFCCFLSGSLFLCCCTQSGTDLRELSLPSGVFYLTVQYCHSSASATDLREIFLLSGVFYFTLLPNIWYTSLLSRLPWEPVVLPWRL